MDGSMQEVNISMFPKEGDVHFLHRGIDIIREESSIVFNVLKW